jgi:hypothetical protein
MEVLAEFGWLDLAILALLALGAFLGFTGGTLRYGILAVGTLVVFVVAAHLRGPLGGMLGVWEAFPPEGRELFFFLLLFFGLIVALWLVVRAVYGRTRLPVPRQLDEIGGAVLGVVLVVVILCLHVIVLESFYMLPGAEERGPVGGYYAAMDDSLIMRFLREAVTPVIGFPLRPFVPREIAQLLIR